MEPKNQTITFENTVDATTVFFFGKSTSNQEDRLFRNCGNKYTTKLRGKYILVSRTLRKQLPDYCYIKINSAVEKEKCFIVNSAQLITPRETTKAEIDSIGSKLVTRPDFAIKDTIKYYNARSKLGNIKCLVVTYRLKGHSELFFDCYLNNNGTIFRVEEPIHIFSSKKADDYSKLYFKDFHEIGIEKFRVINEDISNQWHKEIIDISNSLNDAIKCSIDNYFFNTSIEYLVNGKWELVAINGALIDDN